VDLINALRTTGAVREFERAPVPLDTLHRILDTARFAPSGGNRQGWRVVVAQDPEKRRRLRDLYLGGWYEYLAQVSAGLVPWAPVTDEVAEREAVQRAGDVQAQAAAGPGGFAEHLDEVPALLVVLADLRALAAVDRGFDRYTMAGGASIYPFVWSILLAAREEGLAGVMTTMPIRREAAVKELFGVPRELIVAAVVALGHPVREFKRLRRAPVEEFTTVDGLDGPPLRPA
jgi:nitroreductase